MRKKNSASASNAQAGTQEIVKPQISLEDIVRIAVDMQEVAESIRNGHPIDIDPYYFAEQGIYAYYILAGEFAAYGASIGNTYEEAEAAHTNPEAQKKVDALMGQHSVDLKMLWEDYQETLRFMARKFWTNMRTNAPQGSDVDFVGFHRTIALLNMQPRTPEMFAFISSTPDEFDCVNKSHGMHAVYLQHMSFSQDNPGMYTAPFAAVPGNAKRAFKEAAETMRAVCNNVAAQTGLSTQDIRDYVTAIVQQMICEYKAGNGNEGEPRPQFVN